MINETRRCVAAIAYMMIAGKAANGVFDYTLGGFYNMGCTFRGNYISLFDYRRSCYVSGYLPNLFDYSTTSYINLRKGVNIIDGFVCKFKLESVLSNISFISSLNACFTSSLESLFSNEL